LLFARVNCHPQSFIMVFSRASALRASSITRYARPARCIRAAELQPWQRTLQRRSYASAHGGEKKKSELPW
jgi:UV DNA damage repair endonuclease